MSPAPDIKIIHLQDRPDAVDTLARWFLEEWAPWYGPSGKGDLDADLAAYRSSDRLPICLLALASDDQLLGTASLKTHSLGLEYASGPWLSALLVQRAQRGRRIGSALVAAIEQEAVRLGYRSIFASTDTGASILRRRGWQPIGKTGSLRGALTVFQRNVR